MDHFTWRLAAILGALISTSALMGARSLFATLREYLSRGRCVTPRSESRLRRTTEAH
jgi:hypothetical protein